MQLLAESLGKRRSRQGRTVHYGRTPIVAVGTTDMHSMTQQHQDGARNKVVQFLEVKKPAVTVRVKNPFADASAFALYADKDLHLSLIHIFLLKLTAGMPARSVFKLNFATFFMDRL